MLMCPLGVGAFGTGSFVEKTEKEKENNAVVLRLCDASLRQVPGKMAPPVPDPLRDQTLLRIPLAVGRSFQF